MSCRSKIRIDPVDDALASSKPHLIESLSAYLKITFPNGLSKMDRMWVCYSEDGEAFRILGAFGYADRPDVSMYRVEPGTSRQEQAEAMCANQLMFDRLRGFLADRYGSGSRALFYIEPESQEHWKGFVESIKASKADRYFIEV